jgi:hypothetical protein
VEETEAGTQVADWVVAEDGVLGRRAGRSASSSSLAYISGQPVTDSAFVLLCVAVRGERGSWRQAGRFFDRLELQAERGSVWLQGDGAKGAKDGDEGKEGVGGERTNEALLSSEDEETRGWIKVDEGEEQEDVARTLVLLVAASCDCCSSTNWTSPRIAFCAASNAWSSAAWPSMRPDEDECEAEAGKEEELWGCITGNPEDMTNDSKDACQEE